MAPRLQWLTLALAFAAAADSRPVRETVRLDPPLIQQVNEGCGAASLAMILSYWTPDGADPPSGARIYAELSEAGVDGIRLARMKDFLTEQGFHAFTLRASAEQVEEQLRKRRPVIVGFGHGSASDLHFVVVSGFDRKSFWLHDPARKEPKRLKRKKFQKLWEGGDGWTLIAVPQ